LPYKKSDFANQKPEQAADPLYGARLKSGLASAEAQQRLKQYGFNEVPEKKPNPFFKLARKFWGLSAWMLELIIVLSFFLQRYTDVYIVTGLLVVNAVLGFAEEHRASGAVESLKARLQVNARVLRDGVWKVVPARELVPGDVVRIRAGDFVPADTRVIHGVLEVDQSALTGESFNAVRKQGDLVYSGSIVRIGESTGVVASTGVKTYFGRTAQLVQLAKPKLHIEKVISNVVKWLLMMVSLLIVVAVVFSLSRGFNLFEILPIVLVILLSAMPVALPAMFTVTMALGSMELAKKGVIVTRLSASEDAATMDVLCADKTGTITLNRLSVAKIVPQTGFTEKDTLLYGALASQDANQDPIDKAFIDSARIEKLSIASFTQKSFAPFDSKNRKTEATIHKEGVEFKVVKGAVKTVAEACGFSQARIGKLEDEMRVYAAKGYRTLAVAKSGDNGQLRLVGLVALFDAPRPDSKELIRELKRMGIAVKMLTGDAAPIAQEIAMGVGLGEKVMKASDLKERIKEDAVEAQGEAETSDVFAEVFPEDKYAIVKSLQVRGHVVGMTGDGVNDAPALRQAEVGIAVSNATDVAKGAASVVLVDEGLTSIVNLVSNGRIIYERITAWIVSKVVRTLQVSAFSVFSFILTGSYVVSAFEIIAYFFLTDFVKIALSTDNFTPSDKPDTWNLRGAVKASLILGLLVILESFGLFYVALNYFKVGVDNPVIYSLTFEILFYSAIFLIFNVRERGHFWDSTPSRVLLWSIALSLVVGTVIVTVGIPNLPAVPIEATFFVLGFSAVFSFLINDTVKYLMATRTRICW